MLTPLGKILALMFLAALFILFLQFFCGCFSYTNCTFKTTATVRASVVDLGNLAPQATFTRVIIYPTLTPYPTATPFWVIPKATLEAGKP